MQRSTEVESVPEASRPIRLANCITFTEEDRHSKMALIVHDVSEIDGIISKNKVQSQGENVSAYALVPPPDTRERSA